MGSANFNLFHIGGWCAAGGNDDVRTEKIIKEYEDEHIKVNFQTIKEIVNGRTKNVTDTKSIFNKDGYYKPQQLLASGKDFN